MSLRRRSLHLLWSLMVGLVLCMTVVQPLAAQETAQEPTAQVDQSGALMPRKPMAATADATAGATLADVQLDYTAWERLAARAEKNIADRNAAAEALDALRSQIVDWRSVFLGTQNANAARIATLRAQIAALGPAPGEGTPEAEDIARRRAALQEQLVTLQSPGLAAEEAYSRADGLISEIDRVVRERQADQLSQLWPAPINPANWPEAVIGLTDTSIKIWDEVAEKWANDKARAAFGANVPFIFVLLALAVGLSVYGRSWIERFTRRLQDRATVRGRDLLVFVTSLGEIIFPLLGLLSAYAALTLTEMLGEVTMRVLAAALYLGVCVILAAWLAGRIFPRGQSAGPLDLPADLRAEARYNAVAMAALLGIDDIRFAAMDAQSYSEGTTAVVSYPIVVLAGLLVFRMGQRLHRHLSSERRDSEAVSYGKRLIGFVGQGAMLVGIAGPTLGAIGYVPAAAAMVYPAILSLFAIGMLLVLQDLVTDIYAIVTRSESDADEALLPVLANFPLALASLPVFALIWGARTADLTELWTRFREGFDIGGAKISPTSFLIFAVVFAIGYVLTRMFQGGLKASILPRTSMDQGGQNAITSGVGYVGIFLAALAAINAAGIDLSGLAIVAGALSVGIGFGLQTIVSNFVSGIILLIERPVSEGDWIEVGTTQGVVKSISVRSTRIQTFDRSDVIVPNSDLIAGRVTNWTRFNLTGRLIVPVSVPVTADSRRVEQILREVAEAQPMAILQPPPIVALMGFGVETMNFEIRVILRDVNFQLPVRSEINHQIAARFAAEGIPFSNAHGDYLKKQAELAATAVAPVTEPLARPTRPKLAAKSSKDPSPS